jgi:cytochrome c oxidase cbb3-type subunit 3
MLLAVLTMPAAAPAADKDARFKETAHLYDTYCAQCHGLERNGKGVNTVALSVQPRDHSDRKGMEAIPLDQLATAIKEGGAAVNKSALMPSWGGVLTDAQITDMVAYLRHVCKCDEPAQ